MRRGLMHWNEDELATADLDARRGRLQAALADAGLDGLLLYTNHVRPGAVCWVTGFTPYWAEAILFVGREGPPLFATALSKRVGNWIASVNPTSEVLHSPRPGSLVGERLAALGAHRLGVVELDRLPARLLAEINAVQAIEVEDATALFDAVRAAPDDAELRLVRQADAIARDALATVDPGAARLGDVTGPAERSARLAGVEECYVAAAPDLAVDARLARHDGGTPLGARFAVRMSLAYRGTWIRRTVTFDRAAGGAAADLDGWLETAAATLDPSAAPGAQLAAIAPPVGATLGDWRLEAPRGTKPLSTLSDAAADVAAGPVAYGVRSVRVDGAAGPWLGSRCVGLAGA